MEAVQLPPDGSTLVVKRRATRFFPLFLSSPSSRVLHTTPARPLLAAVASSKSLKSKLRRITTTDAATAAGEAEATDSVGTAEEGAVSPTLERLSPPPTPPTRGSATCPRGMACSSRILAAVLPAPKKALAAATSATGVLGGGFISLAMGAARGVLGVWGEALEDARFALRPAAAVSPYSMLLGRLKPNSAPLLRAPPALPDHPLPAPPPVPLALSRLGGLRMGHHAPGRGAGRRAPEMGESAYCAEAGMGLVAGRTALSWGVGGRSRGRRNVGLEVESSPFGP